MTDKKAQFNNKMKISIPTENVNQSFKGKFELFYSCRSWFRFDNTSDVFRKIHDNLFPNNRLDLVRVQEVRREGSGIAQAGEYTFFYGKGNENHDLGTRFCT
jgi:hypothetical protein